MKFEDLTQFDLLLAATRFEVPGAILRKHRNGIDWVVTDGDGTRTSRHSSMEAALREFCRLSEEPDVLAATAAKRERAAAFLAAEKKAFLGPKHSLQPGAGLACTHCGERPKNAHAAIRGDEPAEWATSTCTGRQ